MDRYITTWIDPTTGKKQVKVFKSTGYSDYIRQISELGVVREEIKSRLLESDVEE